MIKVKGNTRWFFLAKPGFLRDNENDTMYRFVKSSNRKEFMMSTIKDMDLLLKDFADKHVPGCTISRRTAAIRR